MGHGGCQQGRQIVGGTPAQNLGTPKLHHKARLVRGERGEVHGRALAMGNADLIRMVALLAFLQQGPSQLFGPAPCSLKPTAVASIASRGATRWGVGGFATEASTPPQERRKDVTQPNGINQRFPRTEFFPGAFFPAQWCGECCPRSIPWKHTGRKSTHRIRARLLRGTRRGK